MNPIPVPKVSVVVVTYNHAPFLAQCLDSILCQKTEFPFEVVVGDDASTDGSTEIILDYARRYPGVIRPLIQPVNLGERGIPNFFNCLRHARGQYVALTESDDYWLSEIKLQKQVEILDAHPEYVMSIHNAFNLYADGRKELFLDRYRVGTKEEYTLADIVRENFVPTASSVFRAFKVEELPDFYGQMAGPDWLMNIFLARRGKFHCINEAWSVRRLHATGYNGGVSEVAQIRRNIQDTPRLWNYVPEFKPLLANRYLQLQNIHITLLMRRGEYAEAKQVYATTMQEQLPVSTVLRAKFRIKNGLLVSLPFLFKPYQWIRNSLVRPLLRPLKRFFQNA